MSSEPWRAYSQVRLSACRLEKMQKFERALAAVEQPASGLATNASETFPQRFELDDMDVFDHDRIDRILATHRLMKRFAQERQADPLNVDKITIAYYHELVTLLATSGTSSKERALLADASAIVTCFGAVCFSRGSNLVSSLIEWSTLASPGWTQKEAEALVALPDILSSALFWQFVTDNTLQGKFELAINGLEHGYQSASSSVSDATLHIVGAIVELLRTYPVDYIDQLDESIFQVWKRQANNLRSHIDAVQDIATRNHLESFCMILQGIPDAIVRNARDWESAIVGLFLFVEPNVDMYQEYVKQATAIHPLDSTLDWQVGCFECFQGELLEALASLKCFDTCTAVALSELLKRFGALDMGFPHDVVSHVLEQIALSHALECLSQPALVNAALEFFEGLRSSLSKSIARKLLPEVVEKNPAAQDAALTLAERLGLPDTIGELHNAAARKHLHDRQYLGAIKEYDCAKNHAAVASAGWALFEQMLTTAKPIDDDETIQALRLADVNKLDISLSAKLALAPSAVLLKLLATLESQDYVDCSHALSTLLLYPRLPIEYYPLLVGIVARESLEKFDRSHVALLMMSLDTFEDESRHVRKRGLDLLNQARDRHVWEQDLDSGYTAEDIIWMIRRRLANDVSQCL